MAESTDGSSSASMYLSLLTDGRLAAVLMIAFVGPLSVNVASPALPVMASSLGVSSGRIGLVMTAITLPAMVLAPVAGVAGDIYGRRPVALAALFGFGTAGVAIAYVDSFHMVLLLRGIQGVGMVGIAPVAITLLGDLYTDAAGSAAQGLRSAVTGISASVTSLLAGWLADMAWQLPFFLYAIPLLVVVVTYLYVPETTRRRSDDRGIVAELREYGRAIRAEVTSPTLVVLVSGGFVRFFALFGLLTFIPLYVVQGLGATATAAGAVLAFRALRIVTSPTAGFWVAYGSRLWAFVGAGVLLLATVASIPFVSSITALGALVAVNAVGDGLFSALLNDTVTAQVSDDNRNGVVSGMRTLKEFGKTAAPVVLGVVLAVGGFRWVFVAIAAVLFTYLLLVVVVIGGGRFGDLTP